MTKKTLLTFALLFTISCGYEETEDQSNVDTTSDSLTTTCAVGYSVCGGKLVGTRCSDRVGRGTCQVNTQPNYCLCTP